MEFELDGKNYILSKMSAMKQFHIVRRMMVLLKFIESSNLDFDISQIASEIANLSDDDSEYVIYGLLSHISVRGEKGIITRVAQNNVINDSNMDMKTMLLLCQKAMEFNLKGFLEHASSTSIAE